MIFQDKVNVDELPQVWNDKMAKLLSISPPNDAKGILQDVHWSGGAFGYFPTYTLGNLYGAQIYNHALEKNSNLLSEFSDGNYGNLLNYLRERYNVVAQFAQIKKEEWQSDGSWVSVVSMPAGLQMELLDKLNKLTHGRVQTKLMKS